MGPPEEVYQVAAVAGTLLSCIWRRPTEKLTDFLVVFLVEVS